MKISIQTINFLVVTFLATSNCVKNEDESRPYEFGFTIDGEQHRHETKDINGIIQGEYGFITADGVYHVTVYATDENGNFRILSMRNIRLGPLSDKSAGSFNKPEKVDQTYTQTTSSAPSVAKSTTITSSTSRPLFVFTTLPTIKPACAGCGYVTTQAPKPGEKFPFQTLSFQSSLPTQNNNDKAPGIQETHYKPQSNREPNRIQDIKPQHDTIINPDTNYHDQNRFGNGQNVNKGTSSFNNNNNNSNGNNYNNNSPLTEVAVSDGKIQVPGKSPIPISDKYPGMVDGLPDGIKESDITDILYRFTYAVGFHGHYEKGYKNGAKIGGYFVNGRDGISRIVTYVADENGYRPKFKLVRLGLESPDTPKEETEKSFGLKSFEFVWYPVD